MHYLPATIDPFPFPFPVNPLNVSKQLGSIVKISVLFETIHNNKKGKRKIQGVPQSQTAALPRPQEEEETDKSKQAQTEQTYEKH